MVQANSKTGLTMPLCTARRAFLSDFSLNIRMAGKARHPLFPVLKPIPVPGGAGKKTADVRKPRRFLNFGYTGKAFPTNAVTLREPAYCNKAEPKAICKVKNRRKNMSQTQTRNTNRKWIIALPILVALAAIFGAVYLLNAPKAVSGAKELSIEVVDDQAASTTYTVHTDAEYLRQALEETEGLTVEGTESEYGLMVETVNGVRADYNTDGAYWAFFLNDEYCNYGIDQQPVEDGQSYKIVYTTGE